jgi:hypothetical protein
MNSVPQHKDIWRSKRYGFTDHNLALDEGDSSALPFNLFAPKEGVPYIT